MVAHGFPACLAAVCGLLLAWQNGRGSVELLDTDLFARPGWSAADVQVAGGSLGQSRRAVVEAVRRWHFSLAEGDDWAACKKEPVCVAITGKPARFTGLEFHFDAADLVSEIVIEVDPDLPAPVYGLFSGRLRAFFGSGYSEATRLGLLGQEKRKEYLDGRWGRKVPDVRYFYPERGVTLTVSAAAFQADASKARRQVVSRLSFVRPER